MAGQARLSSPRISSAEDDVTTGIKEASHGLVESLADESDWDDLMRVIYERIQIEEAILAAEQGRVVTNADVRKQFGLPA